MFPLINSYDDDDFHNIFIKGDWNYKNITKFFGDRPTILARVLERRSCSVDIVKLLLKQGAAINFLNHDFYTHTKGFSPLMIALGISNNEAVIRVLLEGGADVNMVDSFGYSPLLIYLKREDCSVSVVEALLDFGAYVNHRNVYSDYPLATAIQNVKDDGVIQVLVERGAVVNDLKDSYNTPLILLLRQRKNCSVDTVKLLLAKGADINCVDKYGCSPLVYAIQHHRDNAVIQTLLANGADINCVDKNGCSALVYAIQQHRDDAVIQTLLSNGANVNIVCEHGKTPLILYLSNRADNGCTVDIVKLLLAKGAYINYIDKSGCSPLVYAIQHHRDEAVIQTLLENGANVNIVCGNVKKFYLCNSALGCCSFDIMNLFSGKCVPNNNYGNSPLMIALKNGTCKKIIQMLLEGGACADTLDRSKMSPLCIALRHSTNDIVKLLLDAGSSLNACRCHLSALHCAIDFSCSEFREDNLKLLLEKNVDVNRISRCGQSLLCYALQHGAKAHDIQLLLDAGASLNTCVFHPSPLVCATDNESDAPLREDVIQLLLGNGASVNDKGLEVLQRALQDCNYETGAIRLLLDLPGMDAYVIASESDESLLHRAVQNPNCKLDAVKLLVNRKVPVNKVNQCGQTPLHCAVMNPSCDPKVINFLLQNGSLVNAKDTSGDTALTLAVKLQRPSNILKDLLISGAHIGKTKFSHGYFNRKNDGYELLEFLARQWDSCWDPEIIDTYKMLLKFFLLQNPEFNIRNNFAFGIHIYQLMTFLNKCLSELGTMDSLQVGHGHTFRMFVCRDCLCVEKMYDLDRILVCLTKNTFPVYFDVISARIGRSVMEAEVRKLQVYTSKSRSDLLYVERVPLNSDVVFKISQYLLDDDNLLRFILAFYKPINQNDSGESSKDDPLQGNSEPSTKPLKYQKLCH